MSVEVIPIRGIPEVRPGDDLAGLLVDAIAAGGIELRDGDVLVVTQKVVSKAEGRVVPEAPDGKASWVARETRRVLASRVDVVIAETAHGFVCANAGVDASNVGEGLLTLLPVDPDLSAERLRSAVSEATGAPVSVVLTDTFGRAWRRGVVNVAIGCAGLPSLIDLRGTKDAMGRVLEATVVALADEVAAASGLVMGKAEGIPAAVVRGVRAEGPPAPAATLVRPPEEDMFRESPIQAVRAGRPVDSFGSGGVSREAVTEALAAAAGPGSEGEAPLLVVALRSRAAMAGAVSALIVPGGPADRALAAAPSILIPCARLDATASREAALLSAGRAVERLALALRGTGLATGRLRMLDAPPEAATAFVGLEAGWEALGMMPVGPPPEDADRGAGGAVLGEPPWEASALLVER